MPAVDRPLERLIAFFPGSLQRNPKCGLPRKETAMKFSHGKK
jgi:hypothetical protein